MISTTETFIASVIESLMDPQCFAMNFLQIIAACCLTGSLCEFDN